MTIDELSAHLRSKIQGAHPGLLEDFSVSRYVDALAALPKVVPYDHVSADIYKLEKTLTERFGAPAAALYFQLALCELIQQNGPVVARGPLPESVKARFQVNFQRILSAIENETCPPEFYRHRDDKFLKDIGVASGRVIPAGAQKINTTRLPLRIVKGLELLKLGAFAAWHLGKLAPIFDMHTDSHDPDLLAEFSETGWRNFYITAAHVLEQRPDVIGMYGIGWFFDPAVAGVSPRLGYVRELTLESGARSYCVGPTEGARGSALATSPTRKKLYEEKKYLPQDYLVVWDRKSLIEWARRAR